MFEPGPTPRIFAQAPGTDFPRAVVDGLIARTRHLPPEALARTELYVNTRRMQRRIRDLFDAGPALLLPRIRLVTDLGQDVAMTDLPPAVSPLRRRLELAQLVGSLLQQQPDLAPRAAIYELADSLAALMDEMQGEGVDPAVLRDLDVGNLSDHWARSLKFLDIVQRYFGADSAEPPDTEARQRRVIERLTDKWRITPPDHPVIVAGSTGSRGATGLFMRAVAGLPQGAVILPGFDFDLPAATWDVLNDPLTGEDHPQFRFSGFLNRVNASPADVRLWQASALVPNPARNRLLSLALRPAPVTDQWQREGPAFAGCATATDRMTLIEAPSPRAEAVAIALCLRKAAEDGRTAALITPDRMLTRQVTAALDRWGIEPDDSAGRPLALTAPGRFLRHVSELFSQRLTAPMLLTLLKHPLTNTGAEERGDHLRWTRDLELQLLRRGLPFPTSADLIGWCDTRHLDDAPRRAWAAWVGDVLCGQQAPDARPLSEHLRVHLETATTLARGPGGEGSGELWLKPAGREASRVVGELQNEAGHGGTFLPRDYRDLFRAVLDRAEVRDPIAPHTGIMIWGTLEARVQGADLVILGGLNEGTWPEAPGADPWMNRQMRHDAGLLLPDRRIGLSAHDFQQAIAADRVVLTRAIRDAESETVAARWLNRLCNLLSGMSSDGDTALKAMRARGESWLALASRLETPSAILSPPATRPSPQPPRDARPKRLSVTRISKLIRDPYAIYAEQILRLKPLDPLHQTPDAPLRGTILHKVLETYVSGYREGDRPAQRARLLSIAREVLEQDAPWPATRILWMAKLERVADWFLDQEDQRRAKAANVATERPGRLDFGGTGFTLTGTADRIDRTGAGAYVICDYKSGSPPTPKAQRQFDKQLLLEAVIAEAGGFRDLPAAPVSSLIYIGLGATPKIHEIVPESGEIDTVRTEFEALIRAWQKRARGYTSRRALHKSAFDGDYDHLARFGEWDDSDAAAPSKVGG